MKYVNKSYKYRLYPSKEHHEVLEFNMGCSWFVFNHIKALYEIYRKQVVIYGLKPIYANRKICNTILNDLKKYYSFLKEANSTTLQKSYDNLISAYKMVGKANHGWVKFKSRKDPVQSFRTLNIKIINGKLKLPKISTLIPMKYSQVLGDILTATITKNNSKHYFISINVNNNPVKPLKEIDNKIKRQHQILSKRVKNGCNWSKAKTKLNTLYQKKKKYNKRFSTQNNNPNCT